MTQILLALYLSMAAVPAITLERTACFGTCPVYTLTIFNDGKVVYEGKDFVKREGKGESKITKAELEKLVREFTRIDYFNLDDDYIPGMKNCPEEWTDHPTAITSLSWQGRNKRIRHYHGCRGTRTLDQLTALENKIDEVVNTKRWIE